MYTESETGSVWQVLTSYLGLGHCGAGAYDNYKILLNKGDLVFVLYEDDHKSILLTRSGIVEMFYIWQKYCVRLA